MINLIETYRNVCYHVDRNNCQTHKIAGTCLWKKNQINSWHFNLTYMKCVYTLWEMFVQHVKISQCQESHISWSLTNEWHDNTGCTRLSLYHWDLVMLLFTNTKQDYQETLGDLAGVCNKSVCSLSFIFDTKHGSSHLINRAWLNWLFLEPFPHHAFILLCNCSRPLGVKGFRATYKGLPCTDDGHCCVRGGHYTWRAP